MRFYIDALLALRSKYIGVAGCSLLVLLLSLWLAAQFSGRQPSTVALDVGISLVRLIMPFVLILLAQELLSREFERRYFLNSLSYPYSRHVFFLGRFFSLMVLGLGLLLVMAVVLAGVVFWVDSDYAQGTPVDLGLPYFITFVFIALDLLVLAALAFLLAVVSTTPGFVLIGTLGFMLVARSFSAIIELLSRDSTVVANAEGYRAGVGLLGYLLPDLGALDVRMITLYGQMEFLPADWVWLVISNLVYAFALLALAVWALHRKRFS